MDFSRKKLLFMSIIVLMMILLSNIFGYANNNYSAKSGITTANVNFRKNTNLDYSSRIKTLTNGTEVQFVGEIDNFYISILNSGEVGLISKDYSKIVEKSYTDFYNYIDLEDFYATVNDNNTNLRGGPSTSYASYTKLKSGDKVQIIGKIDNFFLVITNNNYVGMIREDLISKIDTNENITQTPNNPSTLPNTPETILTLINNARIENGLPKLQIDDLLNSTAVTKATDMVENNYFSHTSPTYGSPFEMMQNAGITYKVAGENIAGNSSIENAVKSWLASDEHKSNILSNAYNYIGIGVKSSDTYGYVIVTMFIGK